MLLLKVAIDVPSGKLICGNDFREQYPVDPVDGKFNINEKVGIKLTTEAYAKVGMFHGFVGNSCPSLYVKDNTINILNAGWNKKTDKQKRVPKQFGKRVGSICTDLWWYSVADYDDFIKRGGVVDKQWDTIINVEPGRYVLCHNLDYNDEWHERFVYAVIYKSDEKLIPWTMPEEGVIKDVMKMLPKKFLKSKTIDVAPPKDADEEYIKTYWLPNGHNKHTISSYLFVETAYEYPKADDCTLPSIPIGYRVWGHLYNAETDTEKFLGNLILSAEELRDHQLVLKKVLENYELQIALNREQEELHAVNRKALNPEELKAFDKRMEDYQKP